MTSPVWLCSPGAFQWASAPTSPLNVLLSQQPHCRRPLHVTSTVWHGWAPCRLPRSPGPPPAWPAAP
ncbi:Hypothetical predicted protein [Lynx pardinus]|uniref:Uncharacterized protein n=1 Tax=Lynx pardinus TaxID=191816 RepID=A0A485NJN8_LYNPA|nr:Hypothetical predicted protein [Lynx pardinus]